MRSIVVLAFIAVALLVAVFSRFAGLLLYWWFAIFRPQDWIWMDVAHLRLSFVAGIVLVVPCFLTGKFPRFGHVITYLMVVYLSLVALATYINGCGAPGWKWLDHMWVLMLVLLLTNRLLDSPRRVFWLCGVVAGSLAFFSAKAGFFALIRGGVVQYDVGNLEGTFSGSNAFALGTAMMVFWMIATAQNALNSNAAEPSHGPGGVGPWRVAVKVGMWAAAVFSTYQVVSLFSRGSALGLAMGFAAFFVLQRRRTAWFLKLVPVILAASLFVPVPEGYRERIGSVFAEESERDRSASSRPHYWRVATRIVEDYPLGIGTGCYSSYYDAYDPTDGAFGSFRSVHSSHYQVLAEGGYLGISIWILLFVLSVRTLLRVRRAARQGALPSSLAYFLETYSNALIASMVTFFVGGSFYELAHNELTWLSFTLAVVLERLAKEAKPEPVRGDTPAAAGKPDVPWYRRQTQNQTDYDGTHAVTLLQDLDGDGRPDY